MKEWASGTPSEAQCYYRFAAKSYGENDVESIDTLLQVNCCGEAYVNKEYRGGYRHGRRDFYIIYMQGGEMLGSIGDASVHLERGSFVCMSPKTPCIFHSVNPMKTPIKYYWIHFTGSDAGEAICSAGIEPNRVYRLGAISEVLNHFEKLFTEFRLRATSKNFDYATGVELRYILHLIGKVIDDGGVGRLDNSLKYIHAHIADELSVEALATMEYLGVSRYREVFKSVTGMSPVEYITALRMARAKDLLSDSNATVAEIAALTGYLDGPYFQRVFKSNVGVTPGEYRKSTASSRKGGKKR